MDATPGIFDKAEILGSEFAARAQHGMTPSRGGLPVTIVRESAEGRRL